MIPLFSVDQIRYIDKKAVESLGFEGSILMENASINIYNAIIENFEFLTRENVIGIICGRGNNGGDGFAVARHFANNGFIVKVLYLYEPQKLSNDALFNFNIITNKEHYKESILLKKYQKESDIHFIDDATIVLDAMLGSGFSGELKEPYKSIVSYINNNDFVRVAVDVPTGLNPDTGYGDPVFNSDLTITLGELKKGLFFGEGYAHSGKVVKGDIGINNKLYDQFEVEDYVIEPEDVAFNLPEKRKDIHKYSAGKVLSIAGSAGFPGAALLTAFSALKSGAGASVLAFPVSARVMLNTTYPELVYELYNDECSGYLTSTSIEQLKERILWADCIAVGPGIGREEATIDAIKLLLKKNISSRIVIDADAIFALAKIGYQKTNLRNCVLTPHLGEFASLINTTVDELKKDLLKIGKSFAQENKCHLLLKGPRSIIFNPAGEAFINSTGNPGMAKFGTGDVLTGMIAGFISQYGEIENGLITSLYLHSLTGDLLKEKYSEYGFTAVQLIEGMPDSINFLRNSIA